MQTFRAHCCNKHSLTYIVETAELMKNSIQITLITRRKRPMQMVMLNWRGIITGEGMLKEHYMHYNKKSIVFLRLAIFLCFGVYN